MTVYEILDEYRFWDDLVKRKMREIDRLNARQMSITAEITGMPRGSSHYTMNDYLAEKEELEADLDELRHRRSLAYDEITHLVLQLDNVRQRKIILLRFVDLKSWKAIRKALGLSRTRVYELYNDAMNCLEKGGSPNA